MIDVSYYRSLCLVPPPDDEPPLDDEPPDDEPPERSRPPPLDAGAALLRGCDCCDGGETCCCRVWPPSLRSRFGRSTVPGALFGLLAGPLFGLVFGDCSALRCRPEPAAGCRAGVCVVTF